MVSTKSILRGARAVGVQFMGAPRAPAGARYTVDRRRCVDSLFVRDLLTDKDFAQLPLDFTWKNCTRMTEGLLREIFAIPAVARDIPRFVNDVMVYQQLSLNLSDSTARTFVARELGRLEARSVFEKFLDRWGYDPELVRAYQTGRGAGSDPSAEVLPLDPTRWKPAPAIPSSLEIMGMGAGGCAISILVGGSGGNVVGLLAVLAYWALRRGR